MSDAAVSGVIAASTTPTGPSVPAASPGSQAALTGRFMLSSALPGGPSAGRPPSGAPVTLVSAGVASDGLDASGTGGRASVLPDPPSADPAAASPPAAPEPPFFVEQPAATSEAAIRAAVNAVRDNPGDHPTILAASAEADLALMALGELLSDSRDVKPNRKGSGP